MSGATSNTLRALLVPRLGLQLAIRHARLHPNGTLSQERDAIRVRARIELAPADADYELKHYMKKYPNSPYTPDLQRRLKDGE